MAVRAGSRDGFSLMEMMVGCVVIGIVLAAATPNLRSYRESHRIWSESQVIASICKAAQSRARSENHNIIVECHPDDNQYLVIDDENNNSQPDDGEQITTHPIREGLTLSSTTFADNRLVFDARGRATNGGTILLRGDQSDVLPKRVMIAAGTGQIRILGGGEP